MARAVLDDWPWLPGDRHVEIALDDDAGPAGACAPCSAGPVEETLPPLLPVLTVRYRTRLGYGEDSGDPIFGWQDIVTAEAAVYEQREEFDGDAGFTLVKATASVPYDGDLDVTETISVIDADGAVWRVNCVTQVAGRLDLKMQRIDQREGD